MFFWFWTACGIYFLAQAAGALFPVIVFSPVILWRAVNEPWTRHARKKQWEREDQERMLPIWKLRYEMAVLEELKETYPESWPKRWSEFLEEQGK